MVIINVSIIPYYSVTPPSTFIMAKASGGLLLGVVREACRRGHEAENSRAELERAHVEQARLTALINSAISEKRKVCHVASQAFS